MIFLAFICDICHISLRAISVAILDLPMKQGFSVPATSGVFNDFCLVGSWLLKYYCHKSLLSHGC